MPFKNMKSAISSFRERGWPPARTLSGVMGSGSVPGLVTSMRSEKTSNSTFDPVIA